MARVTNVPAKIQNQHHLNQSQTFSQLNLYQTGLLIKENHPPIIPSDTLQNFYYHIPLLCNWHAEKKRAE